MRSLLIDWLPLLLSAVVPAICAIMAVSGCKIGDASSWALGERRALRRLLVGVRAGVRFDVSTKLKKRLEAVSGAISKGPRGTQSGSRASVTKPRKDQCTTALPGGSRSSPVRRPPSSTGTVTQEDGAALVPRFKAADFSIRKPVPKFALKVRSPEDPESGYNGEPPTPERLPGSPAFQYTGSRPKSTLPPPPPPKSHLWYTPRWSPRGLLSMRSGESAKKQPITPATV